MPKTVAGKNQIAILILAAGTSTRMMQPKQLLKHHNKTLLNICIETALTIQKKDIYVVLGANKTAIEPSITSNKIGIINNKNYMLGIGSSISCGITKISKEVSLCKGVLILLADQPLISTAHLKNLLTQFNAKKHPLVATSYNGTGGVPAVFSNIYFEELMQLNPTIGAAYLLEKNKAILVDANGQNIDIDTPEDYSNLKKH